MFLVATLSLLSAVALGVDDGACIIVKRFEPAEGFKHTKDCEDGTVNCEHDFVVQVWLNEGDKATGKQTTNVAHNQDSPEWNERLCWQSQMSSVNFMLYEDDYFSSQDTEYFIDSLSEATSAATKRRSRDDLRIGLKNSENEVIGILYYSTDLEEDLWGFTAREQTCHEDNLLLEITEPTWFTPLKGGWINGPKKPFTADGSTVLIKRYAEDSVNAFGDTNLCEYIGEDTEKTRYGIFSAGYYFNSVALLPWHHAGEGSCTHYDIVKNAEDAGAVGVIFFLSSNYEYGSQYMMNTQATSQVEPTATIPARWIEAADYEDIRRTWDVHDMDQILTKLGCPWQFEQDFMPEMCVSDTFFAGKYEVLKTDAGETVTVNDHAVWKSTSLGGGLPFYVVNTKNIDVNELGIYRWVVSTSLSAEYLLAVCQTTTRIGESMEPNDCENWEIYDKQYNAWQQHPLSIIDFCPTGSYDFDSVSCGHTAVQFQVDDAGPMEGLQKSYPTVVALFGPARYETGSVELELLDGDNYMGCEPYDFATKNIYKQPADVKGKIVIVSRGSCFFSLKQVMAEQAGAIGIIVVNYEDANVIYMGHSGTVAPGSIPARMMSYADFQPIRDAMKQLGPPYPLKGGFYCPQSTDEPPAEVCIGQNTNYSDDWGFHNDFHGTFVRLRKDFNDHPAYRLDPLSNTSLGTKIYGTKTSGVVEEGIDHTKTYLYYDAGGVGDVGNAWKIGPTLGSGEEHIYAYCQGALYADVTDPAQCDRTGGSWETYLPSYHTPDFYSINDGVPLINDGQCSWDMATGDGWDDLPNFDGIFCKRHKDCLPNEYCMDCSICLDKFANDSVFKGDMFTHPCSYCFYERDEKNKGDDNICQPLVSCSAASDASFRDDEGDTDMVCINTCTTEEMGIDGECPKFPGCDTDACMDTESLWGNGVCNSECGSCPEWQDKPFDGTDCDGRDLQLVEGQVYEASSEMANMECATVISTLLGPVKYTIQMIGEVTITDVQGSRVQMELQYRQFGEVADEFVDTKRTLQLSAVETSLVSWEATATPDDDSVMQFTAFEGKIGRSEDYITNKNPEGFYITLLPQSGADLPYGAHMECQETILPMTDTKIRKDKGDDSEETPTPGTDTEDEDSTEKCLAFSRKMCKAGKKGAKEANCEWHVAAQKGKGACLWVPPAAPVQEECTEGDGKLTIKGKGVINNYKKQAARNMNPCACLQQCQIWYESRGPFVAFTLETGVKKGKDYAQCTCWKQLKKVNDSAGTEFQSGSLIPGYLDGWMKKKGGR